MNRFFSLSVGWLWNLGLIIFKFAFSKSSNNFTKLIFHQNQHISKQFIIDYISRLIISDRVTKKTLKRSQIFTIFYVILAIFFFI